MTSNQQQQTIQQDEEEIKIVSEMLPYQNGLQLELVDGASLTENLPQISTTLLKCKRVHFIHSIQENQPDQIEIQKKIAPVTSPQLVEEVNNLNSNDNVNASNNESQQDIIDSEEQLIEARLAWQRERQNSFFSTLRTNVQRINFNAQILTDEELTNIRLYVFCLKLTYLFNQIGNNAQFLQRNNDQEIQNNSQHFIMISQSEENSLNENQIALRLANYQSPNAETIDFLINKLEYYECIKQCKLQKALDQIPRYKFQTVESIQLQINGDELFQGIDEWDQAQYTNSLFSEKHLKKSLDDFICSICLEQFQQNEKIIVFSCKHEFHDICAVEWIKNKYSCPLCKQIIVNY